MLVSIFPPGRGGVGKFDTSFALKQDNWNDYSFQTLYHLYYRQPDPNLLPTLIGDVKILRRGQTVSDGIQIREPFDILPETFCSIGSSLDYYQRLNEISASDRDAILLSLRDVVAQPSFQTQFQDEEGWRISLFRDNPDPNGFIEEATAILSKNYSTLSDLQSPLTFHPAHWANALDLNFNAPPLSLGIWMNAREAHLPRRLIALIGRNGSGKSTLLSRLARIAFASPSDRSRPELEAIGQLQPASVGFIRIIAISYSAFDNFIVPGLYEEDLQQIASDIERGTGRYIYAGLRDIVAEVRDDLSAANRKPALSGERTIVAGDERRTTTRLKSLVQLAEEFEHLLSRIEANGDASLFEAALTPLLKDSSFSDLQGTNLLELLDGKPREAFLSWSTGHKIVLHVVASIVAHATRKSLILFDEPEMHLHPPLIAALMHSLRIVLEEKNAVAIVATHSPAILQETLSRHVRIVRRTGDQFEFLNPTTETFGENIGTLTYDAFGLTASATDFYRVLDMLVNRFQSVDEINQLFSPRLSAQALAYVKAGLARKKHQ